MCTHVCVCVCAIAPCRRLPIHDTFTVASSVFYRLTRLTSHQSSIMLRPSLPLLWTFHTDSISIPQAMPFQLSQSLTLSLMRLLAGHIYDITCTFCRGTHMLLKYIWYRIRSITTVRPSMTQWSIDTIKFVPFLPPTLTLPLSLQLVKTIRPFLRHSPSALL